LIYTGNPLRSDILSYCFDKSYNINYRAIYDIIDSDVINLLILGGSQGSYVLSNKISNSMAFLGLFLKNRINIFHQAKQEDVPSLQSYYDNIGVKASVFSLNSDIGHLMSQCHLCITRSGASTFSELACIGVPAILIPMKYSANNHQFFNAQYFKNKDAAIVLEEDGLHPEGLAIFLSDIFAKNTLLFTLRERIKDEGNLLAKENIVRFIEMICRGQGSIVCKDYIRGSHSVDKGFVIK
jgi:UDP-N-acetylglucosamine--N-acetylmuramyl-(pentapeptide) pyrophosphoryl-undecaprenol N-acetylglucosamine transferase